MNESDQRLALADKYDAQELRSAKRNQWRPPDLGDSPTGHDRMPDRYAGDGRETIDRMKAAWYRQMAAHVRDPATVSDPRSGRPDFTPYKRPTP